MLKRLLVKFSPDLLIISGDLANQPVPWQMKRAAEFVREIREACNPVRVLVIPGNHDFKFWGNVGIRRLTRIPFEIYFRRSGLDKSMGQRVKETAKLAFNALGWRGRTMREPVLIELVPEKPGLGLAVFAVNSNTLTEMMAAGKVESRDLQELYRKVDDAEKSPEFAFRYKVAVVHHHPAPLANAPTDAIARIQDSFMLFYNAGLFVNELSRRGFNLVLHGHRHVAGFLRVGCEFDDQGRTVLPIVAAGSASHPAPDDTRGHEMNIIEIYDDDTARLEQRFYSADLERKDESRYFELDTLDDVRLRRNGIFRTQQRHFVSEIRKTVAISKDGYSDITITYRDARVTAKEGLRTVPFSFTTDRPYYLRSVRSSGSSAFEAIKFSDQTPYRVVGDMDLGHTHMPHEATFNYGYRYRLMNGHALTAEEFVRHYSGTDQASEWASVSSDVMCDLATLSVRFPAGYKLDRLEFRIIAEYVPAPLMGLSDDRLDLGKTKEHDGETERLSGYLKHDANGYELTCPNPVPGMIYKLVWRFKALEEEPKRNLAVAAGIAQDQNRLLKMSENASSQEHSHAQLVLNALVNDIDSAIEGSSERFHVSIMVFDQGSRRLKIVCSNLEYPPAAEFYAGEGCAGIAFEKARCVLYHPDSDKVGYFIHQNEWPTIPGMEEAQVLLSIPWISTFSGDDGMYVIGIVNVSSTARTTKLLALFNTDGPAKVKILQDLANLAASRLLVDVQ